MTPASFRLPLNLAGEVAKRESGGQLRLLCGTRDLADSSLKRFEWRFPCLIKLRWPNNNADIANFSI